MAGFIEAESRSAADRAFDCAIAEGVLSRELNARNFAGDYMYMGQDAHGYAFKHIITRQYVHCVAREAA